MSQQSHLLMSANDLRIMQQGEPSSQPTNGEWWEFGDSTISYPPQQIPSMVAFQVSNARCSSAYNPEFGMDPRYCFPTETSPVPLYVALENDTGPFGVTTNLHISAPGDSYASRPNDPDLWNALMLPSFDVPPPDALWPLPMYAYSSFAPTHASPPMSVSDCTSPSSSGRLSPMSVFTSSAASSRRSSVDTPFPSSPSSLIFATTPRQGKAADKGRGKGKDKDAGKRCTHCAATSTPLWRRNPATREPLCNACGLYLQQRGSLRPLALIAADREDDDEEEAPVYALDVNGNPIVDAGPECSHCHTHRTSVWRRSKAGARLCNACGVYARLKGRDRPLALRRNKIKPRCKHAPKRNGESLP